MQDRILALLMLHRHTIPELALLIGEPKDKVAQEVVRLWNLKRVDAYALDGKRVEPPFDSETRFTVLVRYAGFWRRIAAALIDGLLVIIASYAITVLCLILALVIGFWVAEGEVGLVLSMIPGLFFGWLLALLFAWIYYAALESSPKQATVGKMALGMVVTDVEGQRISFLQATGRLLGKIVSALILCVWFIMISFTDRKQGLHDMMAGCLVVVKRWR